MTYVLDGYDPANILLLKNQDSAIANLLSFQTLLLLVILNWFTMRKKPASRKDKRPSSRNRFSNLGFEKLEPKRLLAADIPAFSSDAGLYQVYSNYGKLGEIDLETKTFATAANNAGTKVNAVGFRPLDNYAYGVIVNAGEIARLGSNGEIEALGNVDGLPLNRGTYFVGDFANDDLLYLRNSGEQNKLYGVNVDTLTVENIIKTSEQLNNIYDIAFNHRDEHFYASKRGTENVLISIDLDGQVETVGKNGLQRLTFGAMYADADGSVFGGSNHTGEVYRFDLSTGEALLVGNGPASGSNDGFSNATAVLELTPLAQDDSFTMEGTSTTQGNLFADTGSGSDVDGNLDSFIVSAVNGDSENIGSEIILESGSSLLLLPSGDFTYNPSSELTFQTVGESTIDSFNYTITDETGRTASATASVTVEGSMEPDDFGKVRITGLDSFGGVLNSHATDQSQPPSSAIQSQYAWLEGVGDVNGDGYTDGAVSLPGASGGKGKTFVVFGSKTGVVEDFNVNDLLAVNRNDGSLGSIFTGINSNDLFGYDFSGAGDVNGDGIDDLLISAKDADANGVVNSGQTYVIFGSAAGFGGAEIGIEGLLASNGGDGTRGFVVNGIGKHDLSGEVIASVGDINNDGVDDFAIGAQHADADAERQNSGQTYVVYGSKNESRTELDLATMTATEGFVLNGVRKHDLSGGNVEGGHDVNGDGIDDMLITASNADNVGLIDSGQSYIIFGSSSGFESTVELAEFVNGGSSRGCVIHGDHRGKHDGSYINMIADSNGDGIGELTYGQSDVDATTSGVINGGKNAFLDEIFLSDFDPSLVWLDNFETAIDYDGRSWDTFTYSATLHSSNGTRVTIWGDPHVEIESDGIVERFNIGYGAGSLTLVGGVVINWDTFAPDDPRHPLGPPLRMFKVSTPDGDDLKLDTADGIDSVDNLTSLTNLQLRDFANQLRLLQGDASKPLGT